MRAIVVYESMFGNTRLIAEAIGQGLEGVADTTVVPVAGADADAVKDADLIIVGGPTHAHGMSRKRSRAMAATIAEKPGSGLGFEPGADGPGLREWFASLGPMQARAAAFDTRGHAPAVFTGRASKKIARELRRLGCTVVAAPQSFFVKGKVTHLEAGEEARARGWARRLAEREGLRTLAVVDQQERSM